MCKTFAIPVIIVIFVYFCHIVTGRQNKAIKYDLSFVFLSLHIGVDNIIIFIIFLITEITTAMNLTILITIIIASSVILLSSSFLN